MLEDTGELCHLNKVFEEAKERGISICIKHGQMLHVLRNAYSDIADMICPNVCSVDSSCAPKHVLRSMFVEKKVD